MGACHSHQRPAVIASDNKRKPTATGVVCKEGTDDPAKLISERSTASPPSHTTEMTRESSELMLESGWHTHQLDNDPIPEAVDESASSESISAIISDVPPPPTIDVCTCSVSDNKPRHQRKKSGMIVDYLQAEGPSSNRVMVHIETPFGLPIEEVYDGVHNGNVLGEGIAGKVRLITHRQTGIQRAVKRLDLGLVTKDEDLERLLDEIKIMCALDHPNVVCLEEVFEGENELFLTQELCSGGDLFDRLDAQPELKYTEAACAHVMKQIISSVSYLHSKDIIHRDLKLENFLFQDNTQDGELKMIDFGLSKHFVKGEIQHESVGTPYTVAPELLRGDGYDEKCDVWGIGVITYLLLCGETPFGGDYGEGEDLTEVKKKILAGHVSFDDPVWLSVSKEAIDFIQSLLVLDPTKRPRSCELKDHPWLKTMKRNSSIGSDESYLSDSVVNGLVQFKSLSHTRKFLREVISYTLQPEQITGLHAEFEKIDVEDKGEISLKDFKAALIANSDQHPLSEAEIEEIFIGLKVRNTDMSIRWHEFIAACLSQCHIDDRNIKLAFDRLDTEHKGFITLSDLKCAMDFYDGTDSRCDLQSMWINNIIDYRTNKEHMTYADFYNLLKLDKERECANPSQSLIQQSSTVKVHNSLTRSLIMDSELDALKRNDQDALDSFNTPLDDMTSSSHSSSGRRHSMSGKMSDLDLKKILDDAEEPRLLSAVKVNRDIQDYILEATKRAELKNRHRRITVDGYSLVTDPSNSTSPRFTDFKKYVSDSHVDECTRSSSEGSPKGLFQGSPKGSPKGLFMRRESQDYSKALIAEQP